jgi:glycine cleavage system H protein
MRPEDYKYTETHEWLRYNPKSKEAVIGITDHAVKQLSDLVHLELPKTGDSVESGSPFGEIESVKTVADLVSPLTGKILEVNKEVAGNLDVLKEEPFAAGWLIKIKPSNPSEMEAFMTRKEYDEFLAGGQDKGGEKKESDEDVDEDDFV